MTHHSSRFMAYAMATLFESIPGNLEHSKSKPLCFVIRDVVCVDVQLRKLFGQRRPEDAGRASDVTRLHRSEILVDVVLKVEAVVVLEVVVLADDAILHIDRWSSLSFLGKKWPSGLSQCSRSRTCEVQ